jgi:hypothetical protein
MRFLLSTRASCPDTTSSVTTPRPTISDITPARMSEMVKTCPLASSGWTSWKPTVARVMTVMYRAFSRLQPSRTR